MQIKFKDMAQKLDALECAALVVHTLGDDDAVWEDFLDDDGKRMRRFLNQSQQLVKEANALKTEKALIQRLLREHQISMRVVAGVMHKDRETDEWKARFEQQHEVARRSFKPWSMDEVREEMGRALKQLHAFQWSSDRQTSGVSFLGWREFRRVDSVRGLVHFQLYKTFRGYDMMDYVRVGWATYTESSTFLKVIIGSHERGSHEVLQRLDKNTVIVRGAQRLPHVDVDIHIVYLVFRVPTERGFTQCVRSILCPELQKAIAGPKDLWASNYLWFNWEPLEGDERGYEFKMGGSVGGKDIAYLNEWMMRLLACILRSETLATGRQLLIGDEESRGVSKNISR
jgi:hypothetical protein